MALVARRGTHPTRRDLLVGAGASLSTLSLLGCSSLDTAEPEGPAVVREASRVRLAAIGDYGSAGPDAASVAELVRGFDPDFVITLGDNNYPHGRATTLDDNVGQYYHDFIAGYVGRYGAGADVARFFPALGNHDWRTPAVAPYRDYFQLPGNERYYDVRWGPVHLFALDSDTEEPDGHEAGSVQAMWLKTRLSESTAPWRIVYFHHPPWSSGRHGSSAHMQWPFFQWGASVVLAGHDHVYERIEHEGGLYLVNGLGGHPSRYSFGAPVPGSKLRFNEDHGAMRIDASATSLELQFVTRAGTVIDEIVL
jgi:tartrate-resistant acid phosphatase type 5